MNVFDVLGPVMVGPSSSHTAGAARIAFVARQILGEDVKTAKILLHGSFAQTYKGHGTDKALIGGLLGMYPDDDHIRNSFTYAKQKSLIYDFEPTDLGDVHPNTVKLILTGVSGKTLEVTGCSIGGGNIKIINIDNIPVDFAGNNPTLILPHKDKPGVIAAVTKILADKNINIGTMKVFRTDTANYSIMVIETDQLIDQDTLHELNELDSIIKTMLIKPL